MILRRVIAHFRKQEWTAIAIDFIIVVVGVFVGIQVSNWNASRLEKARAHSYLERIRADLDADLADYDDRLRFWGEVSAFGAEGLDYAESGDPKGRSQWDLLLSYFQASQVAEYFTTSATYDELKSAGDIGLIENVELRDALARYYTYAGNPTLSERPAYRMHVRGIMPLDIQNYIWENCYASSTDGRQSLVDCESPIPETRAAEIANRIRSDEALMNELRYWMSTMNVASRIGLDRKQNAENLRASVNAALGTGERTP